MGRWLCAVVGAILAVSITLPDSAWADSFTFVVWSDSHYGYLNTTGYRDNCIGDINGLAGTVYPVPFAGVVDTPAFVLHTGDITQNGLLTEWENTTPSTNDDYVSGRALLNCPVYETLGNHDHITTAIQQEFIAEHGHQWYSFDHGGVHFVMLDSLDGGSYDLPYLGAEQLAWLAADLAGVGTAQPVIVAMHFRAQDDAESHFAALGDALAGYNICLILHGHEHMTEYNVWRGWDVWGTGQNQTAAGNPYSTISIVHIARGRLQAISYNWNLDAWYSDLYLDKPVTGVPPGAPRIALYPKVIDLETTYGIAPPPSSFTVTNVGDLTLDYSIEANADWLNTTPQGGTSTGESDTIQVDYTVAGLGLGLHEGTINVEGINVPNSLQTLAVNLTVKPIPGDFDADMDVDQEDFGHLQACFTAPGAAPDAQCMNARLDADEDVDHLDCRILLRCLSGADVLPDPQCAAQ